MVGGAVYAHCCIFSAIVSQRVGLACSTIYQAFLAFQTQQGVRRTRLTGVDTLPGAGLFLPGVSSKTQHFAFYLGLIHYNQIQFTFYRSETLQLALFTFHRLFIFHICLQF